MKYNKEYYDQCFKACNVSREELDPAELIRYTRLADTSAILSGRSIDPTFWVELEASGVTKSDLATDILQALYRHQRLVNMGFLEAATLFKSTDLSIYSELMKEVSN